MINVILVIHLLLAIALVAVILLQRSEGGALGIGGNSGGGLMTGRAAGDLLTRTTGILAAGFFITSLGLAILANNHSQSTSIMDGAATGAPTAPVSTGSAPASTETAPAAPVAPAAPLSR